MRVGPFAAQESDQQVPLRQTHDVVWIAEWRNGIQRACDCRGSRICEVEEPDLLGVMCVRVEKLAGRRHLVQGQLPRSPGFVTIAIPLETP